MSSLDSQTSAKEADNSRTLQFAKGLLFAYAGTFILSLQQLLIVPFIVDLFGKEQYGLYVLYLSILSASTALLGWISTASAPLLSKFLHQDLPGRCQDMYQSLHVVHIFFACLLLIGTGLCLIVPQVFPTIEIAANPFLFFSSALYAIVLVLSAVEATALFAAGKIAELNFLRTFSQIFTLASFFLLFVFIPHFHLLILPHLLGSVLLYFSIRNCFRKLSLTPFLSPTPRMHSDFRKLLIKFTSLAGVTSTLRTILMLDPLLLALLFDTNILAEYSYYWLPANFLILALWKLSENAQPFFMEAFAKNNIAFAAQIYRRVLWLNISASLVAAVLYYLLLPYFLALWLDFNSFDSVTALCFAAYIICASVYRLDFAIFYSKMSYGILLLLTALELLIKFASAFALAPYLSAATSVAAHVLAHLLVVQLCAKLFIKREFTLVASR